MVADERQVQVRQVGLEEVDEQQVDSLVLLF